MQFQNFFAKLTHVKEIPKGRQQGCLQCQPDQILMKSMVIVLKILPWAVDILVIIVLKIYLRNEWFMIEYVCNKFSQVILKQAQFLRREQ